MVNHDASPAASPPPFRPSPPLVIGLVGGIASGKSTVATIFSTHGLAVVDADREARQVVEQPAVRAGLRARFGAEIFAADGSLDRAALAQRVFGDDAARRDLEALTHPPVRAALEAQIERALGAGTSVVLDVPLLLEGGLIERCDVCVFVDASDAARAERAAARGWDPGELARREASQESLTVKKTRCPYTITTNGTLEDTRREVDELLRTLGRKS